MLCLSWSTLELAGDLQSSLCYQEQATVKYNTFPSLSLVFFKILVGVLLVLLWLWAGCFPLLPLGHVPGMRAMSGHQNDFGRWKTPGARLG